MPWKILLAVSLLLLLLSSEALAQGPAGRPFGVGVSGGEPTGVTAKVFFHPRHALDFALGWGYWPHDGVALYCDYAFHFLTVATVSTRVPFEVKLYAGLGLKVGFWETHDDPHHYDHVGLGIRFPIGATMIFKNHPFDVFLEAAPVLSFLAPHPPVWFDFDVATGARYYF
jgi:hypothetical protein